MRSLSLLLLVALAALGENAEGSRNHTRVKREFLSRSKRRWVLSTIELEEELKVKYPHKISTIYNDKTGDINHEFVIGGEGEGLFSIDGITGDVFVHEPVDREKKDSYHITFDVWDLTQKEKIDRTLAFDVDIQDINDNAPVFLNLKKEGFVKENTATGDYLPLSADVVDNDKPFTKNSTVKVTVSKQTPAEPKIGIHSADGRTHRLKLEGCFDYDKVKEYTIQIHASDGGTPPLSNSTILKLHINDSNSHQPRFKERKYNAEAVEMTKSDEILRVKVDDKDTPHTDGWRAKYYFLSGNDDELYTITTDKETNDGIIGVAKEKNFDVTTLMKLQIGVENIESLSVCKDGKLITDQKMLPPPDSIEITVKMTDTNDAPVFKKSKEDVFQTEESEPGQVLFTPEVTDIDSASIRFEKVKDPAGWVTVDKKTGKITTVEKMDRESPFVDENDVYTILVAAIDDGQPPATSTSTINIHLRDINDNIPSLVNNTFIMCVNHVDKIMVPAKDSDGEPYSGPFTFSLADDKTLRERWKLDPAYGNEVGLVSQKSLPLGNYSVPMVIQDQQNQAAEETLVVVMCECGENHACRGMKPLSTGLGAAGIGVICAALLVFLLLLAIIACDSKRTVEHVEEDEGNQILIKYNYEEKGTDCKTEPFIATPTSTGIVTDVLQQNHVKGVEAEGGSLIYKDSHQKTNLSINSAMNMDYQQQALGSHRSFHRQSRHSTWSHNKRSTLRSNYALKRSISCVSQRTLQHRVELQKAIEENNSTDIVKVYEHEGTGSAYGSLEELTYPENEDFSFIDNLDPQFRTLGKIIMESVPEKELKP